MGHHAQTQTYGASRVSPLADRGNPLAVENPKERDHKVIGAEDLRNVVVEAVNARDPKLIEEADLPETQSLEETIQTLGERWPRMMMTRGDLEGRPVGVVWMPDRNERYRQVAHVEIVNEANGPDTTLVEGVAPSLVAEDPPGRTVAEWESAIEVDRGEGRWT